MAIYNLSAPANNYAELKAMVVDNANLTLEYDDGADDLVVKHTGLNIYLQLTDVDRYGPAIYVGLSWTSGATLDDGYKVAGTYAVGGINGKVVVNADYFVIGVYNSSTYFYSLVIGKLSNNDVICIGGNGSNDYWWGKDYNITQAEVCERVFLSTLSPVNLGGNYAKLPLYVSNVSGVYSDGAGVPYKMNDFEVLLRPANVNLPVENSGTHLIANFYENHSGVDISKSCIVGEGLYI